MTPPIRFLVLVVGAWTLARVFANLLGGDRSLITPAAAEAPSFTASPRLATPQSAMAPTKRAAEAITKAEYVPRAHRAPIARPRYAMLGEMSASSASRPILAQAVAFLMPSAEPQSFDRAETNSAAPGTFPTPLAQQATSRWSGSAWMLARGGEEGLVASNGMLGGSQTGARLLFRLNDEVSRPLSLSARTSSPLRRQGAEAALGVEWQPFADVPVRILVERRQRVTGNGRSAFALLAHGGVSDRPVSAGLRLDAYAQAGVVGVRRQDFFADAGATLVRPLIADRPAGFAVGAGAWGGVQPGAARLDLGPRVTTSFEAAGRRARVSLDWRFRVAGASAPASGPSLTVGTDF